VILGAPDAELYGKLTAQAEELKTLAQVAALEVKPDAVAGLAALEIEGLTVKVQPAPGAKCVRCWFTYPSVGQDSQHPQVCARCRQVLEG
jgi:isoleucyl-tRNA synthetase